MPSKKKLLLDLAQGMEYVHSKKLIFDSITPKNVFVLMSSWFRREAKWSISSLMLIGKKDENREVIHLNKEELIWKAPELMMGQLDEHEAETIESNVYAVGLVFAYFLLDGRHLYGSGEEQIMHNIKYNKLANLYRTCSLHFHIITIRFVSTLSLLKLKF